MDLTNQNKAKKGLRVKKINSSGSGLNLNSNSNSNALLTIRLPDSRVLQIVSRSFFLAIVLIALPIISPFMSGSSSNAGADFDVATLDILPVIFPDLMDEGLVKRGDKGLIVGSGMGDDLMKLLTGNNGIDLDTVSKLNEIPIPIPNGAFDFVLGLNLTCIKCADSALKTNGIVITQMKNEPSSSLLLQSNPNYRIVYLRRWWFKDNSNTIVAMRKARPEDGLTSSNFRGKMGRRCCTKQEARKMALKGLDDALLEPPRRVSGRMKSMNGRGEMKFLPDLIGDSLEAYKRRMFISISDDKNGGGGGGGGDEDWFYKNYPTRNQHFEVILSSSSDGISDWLRRNVGKQDFVVMKAGEELIEEMMEDKTICLVDELFLECRRRQWPPADEAEETETEIASKRKRAYWQCLALYGDLRDDGVAVHQWWS